jgi:hypothetical protein
MLRHKMKRILLFVFILIGPFIKTKAQDNGEKIQALKIAFITQKLQLTPSEAQRFWPVYDQYQTEIRNLQLDYRNGPALENEERLLSIRKKYEPVFQNVIGPEKTNKFFNAERDFRGILIQRLQNRSRQPMRRGFRR